MPRMHVLIVDDEPGMLEVCRDIICRIQDVDAEIEQRSVNAAARLADGSFDLMIADVRMPGLNGVELLELARAHDPHLAVLMMTAYPTVETAVESMKRGAADYITKPFLPDDLLAMVRRLLEARRLRQENQLLTRHVERPYAFGDMVGRSSAMLRVFETIEQIATSDVEVLIFGETGTGKELVARCLHQRSRGARARFVPIDCGAIPEDLLESEFFGHERGAFTGAQSRSLGLLEFASKGTLFLDEVANLPPKLQAKLLRALQERRVRRVGGTAEFDIDIRLIAATSLDLDEEVRNHRFRSDLYYRINVARIEMPPLRDRREDIPLLASHFVTRYSRELAREAVELDAEATDVLANYAWPGNVRELQNVIKRVLTMSRDKVIHVEDLPDDIVAASGRDPNRSSEGFFGERDHQVAHFERHYLAKLLTATGGDVSAAALEAKLPRGTLYRLLKKHGLNPGMYRA